MILGDLSQSHPMQKSSSNLQVYLKLILFPFVIPNEELEDAVVLNKLLDVKGENALVCVRAEIALERSEEMVGTLVDTS